MLGAFSFLTTSAPFLVPPIPPVHIQILPFKPNKILDLFTTEITMLAFVLCFQSLPFIFYPYQHQVCLPHGLIQRKSFPNPSDHHCSNSISSLPPSPSYFLPLSKKVPNKAAHHSTPGSYLSSQHPLSLFPGQHWNIQCFKIKPFVACWGELL